MAYTARTASELLEALKELANNYWWSWSTDGAAIFRDLAPDLWESSRHNPKRVLAGVTTYRLTQAATDPIFLQRVERQLIRFRSYCARPDTWAAHALPNLSPARPVAYFCAEFGIHESLPNYAGGLGVLAGDHIKSASDLGIPFVGIGLLYREGYFHQAISEEGAQLSYYLTHDFDRVPMTRVPGKTGHQLTVSVQLADRELVAAVWRVDVGRAQLYLLDADIPANTPKDRDITARLYGGDRETRISQEILLGIGGVRALRALGLHPSVYHLNEGHSAFLTLELAREFVASGFSFAEACEQVRDLCVFTTHTPVPAGHDEFPTSMTEQYLGWMRRELNLSLDEFMRLASEANPVDGDANQTTESPLLTASMAANADGAPSHASAVALVAEPPAPAVDHRKFGVTPLALRLARSANGVSRKHGEVSREMWQKMYPKRAADEVPIDFITNGVHAGTWIAPLLWVLYDRHFGDDWPRQMRHESLWERIDEIPDDELWRVHCVLRERLVAYARHHVARGLTARNAPESEVDAAHKLFDPSALTIGFARRFAGYKRGDLLFYDLERLATLIEDAKRPIQVMFAGKAHPADEEGKKILRNVVEFTRDPRFARWIVFLEDYDLNIGRHLVHGVDIWLNNPRRPLEASGTSGEKVALNGGLNLSVLDGWWIEGYDGTNGWAIGDDDDGQPHQIEDRRDAESVYALLEDECIPMFYDRGADGVPHRWVAMMKRSLKTLTPKFNTDRMLVEYAEKFYRS